MMLTEQIEAVELPHEEYVECYDILRNWLVLSKHLSTVDHELAIIEFMHVEVHSRRRPDIVMRLHARLNSIRRENEREELVGYLAQTREPD